MNLAILHHHYNSGGVTRVVQNHIDALAEPTVSAPPEQVFLFHGGRAEAFSENHFSALPFPVKLIKVDGLDYDNSEAPATNKMAVSIRHALRDLDCNPSNTLLHWHNHSLGKNASTPLVVQELAAEGYRLLLQIHDFAEDFRPENYRRLVNGLAKGSHQLLPDLLYPQADHIHYATLNGRDFQVLSEVGIEADQLHLLPNPVAAPSALADPVESKEVVYHELGIPENYSLLTYPVRGIRRKNLGEFLLWNTLLEKTAFHISLIPESPIEKHAFDCWADLAQELDLPCYMGKSSSCNFSFDQLLAASDALITTSVAEGFGMAFLESWFSGKQLLGRNLPEITADFSAEGLNLDVLYQQVLIPCEWIDKDRYVELLTNVVNNVYTDFGLTVPKTEQLKSELLDQLSAETIDFPKLPVSLQQAVIRQVSNYPADRQTLLELNPKLEIKNYDNSALISENADVVQEKYSIANLGKRLSRIYADLWQSEPSTDIVSPPQGGTLLDSFLSLDRLHPVRVES